MVVNRTHTFYLGYACISRCNCIYHNVDEAELDSAGWVHMWVSCVLRMSSSLNIKHTSLNFFRYYSAYGYYYDFRDRGLLLRRKSLNQEFLLAKLKTALRTFYGCNHDLVNRYGVSVSHMIRDIFHLS
jgi:hypothetical protein